MSEPNKKSSVRLVLLWTAIPLCFVAAYVAIPLFVQPKDPRQMPNCINNLRQIDGAIQQWALEEKKKSEDQVSLTDITPYLHERALTCPQGGKYTIGPTVSNMPTCSFPGHVLPP